MSVDSQKTRREKNQCRKLILRNNGLNFSNFGARKWNRYQKLGETYNQNLCKENYILIVIIKLLKTNSEEKHLEISQRKATHSI